MKSIGHTLRIATAFMAVTVVGHVSPVNAADYNVQVQWGAGTAPWNQDGTWKMGGRKDQALVQLDAKSTDGGKTLTGTATYAGEGPVGFKATKKGGQQYDVQLKWGGNNAPWNADGVWTLGGRKDQALVQLDAKSTDGGKNLTGTATYAGEGPIRFKASMLVSNAKSGDLKLKEGGKYTFSLGSAILYVTLVELDPNGGNTAKIDTNIGWLTADTSQDGSAVYADGKDKNKATRWKLIKNSNGWNFVHAENQANALSLAGFGQKGDGKPTGALKLRRNNAGGAGNADQIWQAKEGQ